MPFTRPGKVNQYMWVTDCAGARRQLSCGTPNEKAAAKVERWCQDIRERGDQKGVLAGIVAGEIGLLEAYAAGPQAPAVLASKREAQQNPDLRVHFAAWVAEEAKAGVGSIAKYRGSIERLFPDDTPIRRGDLTPVELRKRALALDVQGPTMNRYLSALSSFARWCVRTGHLPRNPVRDVERWSENESPMRLWTIEQAQEIIGRLEQPYRGIAALMAGAGWEFAALAHGRVQDIRLDDKPPTAFAHGSKNPWRRRICVVTERWAIPLIREFVGGRCLTDGLVSTNVTADKACKRTQAAIEALKLPHATNHDWRHSHAVWLLQRGELPTTVAAQLGHKDTQLVWTRYGRYVTTTRHYRTLEIENA